MSDDFYDQTERIHLGWPGRLLLFALAAALCLLFAGCASPGPVHRTLDRDLGVLCYYTRAGISCLPVSIDDGEIEQDLAQLFTPDGCSPETNSAEKRTTDPAKPADATTAGRARQGD